MKLLEIIFSFIDKNMSAILLWFYNKKVDENVKLQTELQTVKVETEIKTKEEKYLEQKQIAEDKVLVFKRKLAAYKETKNDK